MGTACRDWFTMRVKECDHCCLSVRWCNSSQAGSRGAGTAEQGCWSVTVISSICLQEAVTTLNTNTNKYMRKMLWGCLTRATPKPRCPCTGTPGRTVKRPRQRDTCAGESRRQQGWASWPKDSRRALRALVFLYRCGCPKTLCPSSWIKPN